MARKKQELTPRERRMLRVIRKLRSAAVDARGCINYHRIYEDMASAELDDAIALSEPFV